MSETRPKDPNLRTFAVTYELGDGTYRTDKVEAHNDSFEDGHYILWRYIETNYRVTALRIRAERWESTVDASRDMRKELSNLQRQNAELQDSLHVARAQANTAQARSAELRERLEEYETPSLPDMDDVPF